MANWVHLKVDYPTLAQAKIVGNALLNFATDDYVI